MILLPKINTISEPIIYIPAIYLFNSCIDQLICDKAITSMKPQNKSLLNTVHSCMAFLYSVHIRSIL